MSVVVVTGAAGLIGSMLRPRLARPGRTLRLLDLAPLAAGPGEEAFPVPDYAFPAPDTYYGVAKAATEAVAAMYHHRYGLDAICVRILSCFPRPASVRMLSTWLSPDDAGRLFEACLTAERPGFRVIFGVSANTRGGWVSLAEARALGYQPQDDAEAYAAEIIAEHGPADPATDPVLRHLGGEFTLPDAQVPQA